MVAAPLCKAQSSEDLLTALDWRQKLEKATKNIYVLVILCAKPGGRWETTTSLSFICGLSWNPRVVHFRGPMFLSLLDKFQAVTWDSSVAHHIGFLLRLISWVWDKDGGVVLELSLPIIGGLLRLQQKEDVKSFENQTPLETPRVSHGKPQEFRFSNRKAPGGSRLRLLSQARPPQHRTNRSSDTSRWRAGESTGMRKVPSNNGYQCRKSLIFWKYCLTCLDSLQLTVALKLRSVATSTWL